MSQGRYEVTGHGQLRDCTPWDGRGEPGSSRHRWLWVALLQHFSVTWVQFPSSPRHPLWEWDIYDHERGEWLMAETGEPA